MGVAVVGLGGAVARTWPTSPPGPAWSTTPSRLRGLGPVRRRPRHRGGVAALTADLARFRTESDLDGTVVVNLASTERRVDTTAEVFATPSACERGLDADDPDIGSAMLHAYAALTAGVPYANFTPSVIADVPALLALAQRHGVRVAGKDDEPADPALLRSPG